jgi:energy-coupling factor transporter ATP-binding protein EcfA2
MNRLTGITLENFKAFKKRQYIPIRPLTLIFGPNSAGKSSIVQALALIRHAFYNKGYAEADRVDMGWSEIRLGGWQNLVHAHDSAATFKIGMHFDFIDSSVIDSKSLGSPVSTDYWEVTWEFGRVREDTEAYVMSCSAVKNGSPEFKGTRCSTKPTIWNLEFSSCVPKKAEFVSMLIKYAGAQLPKRYRCKFQAWANATISEDAVFGGLFPGAILPDERKKEEYSYNVYSITPKDYIESLLNPNDCLYPLGDNEPFGPHVALASAIRSITEGTQPSVETENRIKILWNDWIDHHAIYDRVARFFENIANNHLHLDSVRERPAHQLNRRDLPSIPKNKPWLHLIENEQSRNSVNTSLRTLTSPNYYKLLIRP